MENNEKYKIKKCLTVSLIGDKIRKSLEAITEYGL